MAPEAILKLALVKSAEVSRSISIITGQTSPSTTKCLERIVTTLQGVTTIIPWNEMETWICRAEYTLSAFPALYIHFKAFVTLHNDEISTNTQEQWWGKKRKTKSKPSVNGNWYESAWVFPEALKNIQSALSKAISPNVSKILQCRTNRH